MTKARIQFLLGIDEDVIPEIRLTKTKDSTIGDATFTFFKPSVLLEENYKELEGMYLVDDEGQISIREINVSVSKKDGTYTTLQAIYHWNTEEEFDRFMRFANCYAKQNGLLYEEKVNTSL